MNSRLYLSASVYVLLLLSACAVIPTGPRVAVMPTPGKPFELFVDEDRTCRQWAAQSLGLEVSDAANKSLLGSTALGTAIGGAAGALSGGHEHAGTGAALGMVIGSAVGSGQSASSQQDLQYRYDLAYQQCMYAKGNQLPGYPRERRWAPPASK